MKKFANFALTAGMGLNLEGPLWVIGRHQQADRKRPLSAAKQTYQMVHSTERARSSVAIGAGKMCWPHDV